MTAPAPVKLPAGLAQPALELADEGIAVLDGAVAAAPFTWLNSAFARMAGVAAGELPGNPLRLLCAADRDQPGLEELEAALAGGSGCSVLLRCYRPDGGMYWCRLRLEPWQAEDGRRWWLVFARDVSAEHEMELLLGRSAKPGGTRGGEDAEATDRLTGLLAARNFELALELACFSCARDRRSLTLFLFAPDYFDIYLETFGREAGDSCLRMVARAVAGAFRRDSDVSARLEDACFAALGVDMPADVVEGHAERVRERVRALAIRNPRAPRVASLSLSAAALRVAPGQAARWQDLLEQGRATLAAAQAAGVEQQVVQDYGVTAAAGADSPGAG